MSLFLTLAFLFSIGSSAGWILEVFFRRFYSKNNPERRWVNPGYLRGPWLPVYGFGLLSLYLLSELSSFFAFRGILSGILLVFIMTVSATVVEYLSGIFSKRVLHVSLWDYSSEWGNLDGVICPKFTLFWLIISAIYYYFLHLPLRALISSAKALPLAILILGVYLGLIFVDVIITAGLSERSRKLFRR